MESVRLIPTCDGMISGSMVGMASEEMKGVVTSAYFSFDVERVAAGDVVVVLVVVIEIGALEGGVPSADDMGLTVGCG